MKSPAERKQAKRSISPVNSTLQDACIGEFQSLISQSNARIYFKDLRRRFVFANPATIAAVQRLGPLSGKQLGGNIVNRKDEEIFSGTHLRKAIAEDDSIINGMHPVTKSRMADGEWYECHELETWKDGRLVLVHTRKRPWLNSMKQIIGLIGITRPVEIGSSEREFNKQIAPNLDDAHVVYGTYLERLSPYLNWLEKQAPAKTRRKIARPFEAHEIWFDEGFDRAFPPSKSRQRNRTSRLSRREGLGKDRFANVLHADKTKVLKFVKAARLLEMNTQSSIVFRAHVAGTKGKNTAGPVVWIHATASVFSRTGEPYLYVTHRNCRLEEVQGFFSRRILEKFPGNVFVKNRNHEFRYVNQNLANDLGEADPRSAIGKTDEDYHFPKDQIANFHAADAKVLNGRPGACHISPAEPFAPKGDHIADLVTIKFGISEADLEPWMDGNKKLVLGLSWKIDDEWLAYHDGRDIWHSLIEYSGDAIYYKEPKGRYLHCNSEFARLYKKTRDEILKLNTTQLLKDSPELLDLVLREEEEILQTGCPIVNQEHPSSSRPGEKGGQHWISTKLPVKGSDKKTVTRILGLLRNKEVDDLQQLAQLALSPRALKAQRERIPAVYHTQVVVIFCDLRGFSQLANELTSAPEALVDLLQRYMDLIASMAHKHGCELDKFMGDGAMLFRLPDWNLDAPEDRGSIRRVACEAVEFAFDLITELPSVAKAWKAANEFTILEEGDIEMGIGIHVGPATVGLINGGRRLQFTALGKTVNDCSRFEKLAGKKDLPSLLVSPTIAGLIKNDYEVKSHRGLKNEKMSRPFNAYSVSKKPDVTKASSHSL